jgi:hypothetical protein
MREYTPSPWIPSTKAPGLYADSNPNDKEYNVADSKGGLHRLTVRWNDRLCLHFYLLDGKPVSIDDKYGWAYRPSGSPIRDKVLKDNMDIAVFGEVIPSGRDKEED